MRTYDRNLRARQVVDANKQMAQPYPVGYTGHVANTRQVDGQTTGRAVREAINHVAEPIPRLGSTAGAAFANPDDMVKTAKRAANAASRLDQTRRGRSDDSSVYASTSAISYKHPDRSSYYTPAWSQRSTSNIGQPDPYGHKTTLPVHDPTPPRRLEALELKTAAPSTPPPLPREMTAGGRRVAAPASVRGAAGCATRPDIHLLARRR